MKLTIDTARDNPRLIRAAIAMVLAALDNGDALPAGVPPGTILTDNEARNAGFGSSVPLANRAADSAAPPPPPASSSAGASAPPPPPVPSNTAAPPPVPATGSERDSEGLPWDSRIHSSSRAKVQAGTWKLAKGMSLQPVRVEAVKAELRALMALPAGAPPAAPLAPPPPPSPIPGAPAANAGQPPVPPSATGTPPPPPVAPLQSAPPVNAVNDNPQTFAEFMTWVASLITANRWTHQHTSNALGTLGLQNAVGLSARPDLIPSAVGVIKSMLPA